MQRSEPRDPNELTRFLNELVQGRADGSQNLMPIVYDELHVIAASLVQRKGPNASFQATELVHEAFLKLFDPERVPWNDRKHFFALAAKAMRQLVVDHARRRRRQKRGGDRREQTLDEAFVAGHEQPVDLVDLDDALIELAGIDDRQARVVEMRYFGGLSVDDIADTLAISRSTVEREWRAARAWLGVRLETWNA